MSVQTVKNVSPVSTVVDSNNEYIKSLIKRIKLDFIELGLALLKFKGEGQYLHYYDSFNDYVERELNFNKSTAYNLMNIAMKFTVNGKLKNGFEDYTYSQLTCLLPVNEPDLKKYSSDMSVRQMEELKRASKSISNTINSKRLENNEVTNIVFEKYSKNPYYHYPLIRRSFDTKSFIEYLDKICSDNNYSKFEISVKFIK